MKTPYVYLHNKLLTNYVILRTWSAPVGGGLPTKDLCVVHALQRSGSRCKDRSAGTTLQLPASKHACGSHHPAQSLAKPTRELQVQKPLHLPCERRPISVPPNFLYPRQTIRIHILDPHHLLKPKSPMRSSDPTGLDPAMGSFADSETRHRIVHHHRPGVNAPRQCFSPSTIPRPNASGEAVLRVIGQSDRCIVCVECHDRQHRPKRLLAHDAHFMVHIGQHCERVEISA